jgi:hypothetical protein
MISEAPVRDRNELIDKDESNEDCTRGNDRRKRRVTLPGGRYGIDTRLSIGFAPMRGLAGEAQLLVFGTTESVVSFGYHTTLFPMTFDDLRGGS